LFIRHGAQLTPLEDAISTEYNTLIEKESQVEQLKAVTIEGVKIIQPQISGGLSAVVKSWLDNSVSIDEIHKQCREILGRSRIGRRIISGVKIVLAGPANGGKSTLLNTLAGSEKAIVSETAGTTRDWVSVFIHTGPLRAEIIDTAGLGQDAVHDPVDKEAQQRTINLLGQCDCILWVMDCTNPSKMDIPLSGGMPVIRVLNKLDLLNGKMPEEKSDAVHISAKSGDGIEDLLNEIQRRLQVCDFDYTLPVAFTIRQEKLLAMIRASGQKEQIREHLIQLRG
jgi:tRNA modification GTPase